MPATSLQLDPTDAAIILKKDGSFETTLPQVSGDNIPDNIIMGAAIAYALRNSELCEMIRLNFEKECNLQKKS